MTTFWHYTLRGEAQAPISTEQLTDLIKSSGITRYELIWKKGMKKWEPAGKHFDEHFTLYQEKKPIFWKHGLSLVLLVVMLLAIQLTVSLPMHAIIKALFFLIFTGICYTTAVLLRRLYILAKRLTLKKNKNAGLGLKAGTMALSVILGGIFLVQLKTMNQITSTKMAMNQLKEYSFKVNDPTNPQKLMIEGNIGPDFAKTLDGILQKFPSIKIIEVTSGGGLLGETLKAAQIIEQRPQIAVHAKKQCASGCIVILFSAQERWADHDVKLGFHGASNLVGSDDPAELKKHNLHLRLADAYLEKRHVPQDVLPHKYSSTDTKFYYVEAPRLLESGSLTAIMKDGKLLRSASALNKKTTVSKGRIARTPPAPQRAAQTNTQPLQNQAAPPMTKEQILKAEEKTLGMLFGAIGKKRKPIMEKYFETLKQVMPNPEIRTRAVRDLMNQLYPDIYDEAGDLEIMLYLEAFMGQIQYLANQNEWVACVYYDSPQEFIERSIVDMQNLTYEYATFATMVLTSHPRNNQPPTMEVLKAIDDVVRAKKAYRIDTGPQSYAGSETALVRTGCLTKLYAYELIKKQPSEMQPHLARHFFKVRF